MNARIETAKWNHVQRQSASLSRFLSSLFPALSKFGVKVGVHGSRTMLRATFSFEGTAVSHVFSTEIARPVGLDEIVDAFIELETRLRSASGGDHLELSLVAQLYGLIRECERLQMTIDPAGAIPTRRPTINSQR